MKPSRQIDRGIISYDSYLRFIDLPKFSPNHQKIVYIKLKYICMFEVDNIRQIFFLYIERTADHGQATGKLYHLRLRVECTLFCNLQSRVRTHAVLVIGLYELLDPTT